MRHPSENQPQEVLAGLVERVTYHNVENGFCVLRAKARGHRDVVTVVGHAATIAAGEWITASGEWVNDRTHGQQFKARFLRTSPPTSVDGIEKYLSSGMIRGIGPAYAKKLLRAFGEKVFDIIEATPDRLREVDGIGPVRARRITAAWAEQKAVREIIGLPARQRAFVSGLLQSGYPTGYFLASIVYGVLFQYPLHRMLYANSEHNAVTGVPAYPEGRHISNLYLDRRAVGDALETSQIKRYTVPLNGRDATGEVLFDEFAELPTIDYEHEAGLDYGTAYAAGGRKDRLEGFYNQLLRFDLRGNQVRRWSEDGCSRRTGVCSRANCHGSSRRQGLRSLPKVLNVDGSDSNSRGSIGGTSPLASP